MGSRVSSYKKAMKVLCQNVESSISENCRFEFPPIFNMGFTQYFNVLCLATSFLSAGVVAQNESFPLQVDLGYSTYEGVAGNQNVSHWLGVRFAAPPLKDLRWRAPQDPLSTGDEVIAADKVCKNSKLPVYVYVNSLFTFAAY